MNKNLILTISIGEIYDEIAKITHPTIQAYADKIGADFLAITKTSCSTPHWEKLIQIYELLNKYERILCIDTDILIREDAPNIFDVVPKSHLGILNEAPFTQDRKFSLVKACEDYSIKLPNWNGKYYNTGVMVISRIHKNVFKKPDQELFNFYEQGYLNAVIHKNETWVHDLDYKFNRMSCFDQVTGEERFSGYFMHYAGFPNLNMVHNLIKQDKEKWEKDKLTGYKYQRHILLDVQGGLGDQINAEPAIRFMKKYIYPNDDIQIKTHFPRIFQHLKLPTFLHQDWKPQADTPYWHVITLPGPETITWGIVSNLLCHTVDYCAIALLKRTLPFKDRQIKLDVNREDLLEVYKITGCDDLRKLVLVHPGKHWESKTFPKAYWQKMIDELYEAGCWICIIGKDEDETRGIWDLDLKPGMINTKDLLSLGGLIALISEASLLISNDSSPIHIAGAFKNKIILIPTCKHQDHILPYRDFDLMDNKQIALYKKLTLDDYKQAPTELYESRAEKVHGDWNDYLPEINDLILWVKVMLNER